MTAHMKFVFVSWPPLCAHATPCFSTRASLDGRAEGDAMPPTYTNFCFFSAGFKICETPHSGNPSDPLDRSHTFVCFLWEQKAGRSTAANNKPVTEKLVLRAATWWETEQRRARNCACARADTQRATCGGGRVFRASPVSLQASGSASQRQDASGPFHRFARGGANNATLCAKPAETAPCRRYPS